VIENSKITVDVDNCTKCKACVNECPRSLYYFESDQLSFADEFEELCIECSHCVAVCPVNIIQLKTVSITDVKEIKEQEKKADFTSISNLIKTRRSIRQFKEKAVPKELIQKILDIARYAPTGHNEENVHYTVFQDREILKQFSDEITKQITNLCNMYTDPKGRESLKSTLPNTIFEKLEENVLNFKKHLEEIKKGRDVWRRNAELIIIHSPKTAMTPVENCSLAAGHIMLAAESLGLGTCSLGYATAFINQFKTVSKIVKLPRDHKVAYTLAIGYPNVKYFRIPARKTLKADWI